MTLLAKYLSDRQLSQATFARLVGAPAPLVSMWVSGRRRPGLVNALEIERVTRGKIPASYWTKVTAIDSRRKVPRCDR